MTDLPPELSIISGNPDPLELAAIVGAYKSYLACSEDRAVDIGVESQSSWSASCNLSCGVGLENVLLTGKTRKWVDVHRLKSRI